MACAKCNADLPAGSAFCNRCGAPQGSISATSPTVSASAPTVPNFPNPPAAKTQPPEEVVWRGRFSGKSFAHIWTIWLVYAAAIGYLCYGVLGLKERWMHYTVAGFLGAPPLMILWMTFVKKISVRYRLTN